MSIITFAISLGFILATFFTIFGDKNLKNKLYSLLTPQEQQIYNVVLKTEKKNKQMYHGTVTEDGIIRSLVFFFMEYNIIKYSKEERKYIYIYIFIYIYIK